jgi:hypothetical protein
MQDQTLEGGAGEQQEELELSPSTTEQVEGEGSGGDPLDVIQDPVAREEAKKARAIYRRHKEGNTPGTPVQPQEPAVSQPASQGEYLTKKDFYKTNERQAIRTATADPEVKANWDNIVQFYTPRRGKETAEDIAEDIQDAITLFKARNPNAERDTSATELSATPVIKTGGGTPRQGTPTTPTPPNFKLPVQPDKWYTPKK